MTNITLEIFQSPIRMTHCGHVYCEECLLNISNGEQRWDCPDCRTTHNCAVTSLPRNYHLEKLVEKFKKDQSGPKPIPKPRNVFGICKKHDRSIEYREWITHFNYFGLMRAFSMDHSAWVTSTWIYFKDVCFMAEIPVLIACLHNCVVILRKPMNAILWNIQKWRNLSKKIQLK